MNKLKEKLNFYIKELDDKYYDLNSNVYNLKACLDKKDYYGIKNRIYEAKESIEILENLYTKIDLIRDLIYETREISLDE